MEQAGYFDVARSIRNTRWGVDKFSIEIIDTGQGRGVVDEEEREQ
jgi:hypothetical protein